MPMDPELAAPFAKLPNIDPRNRVIQILFGAAARFMPVKRTEGVELRHIRSGRLKARLHVPTHAPSAGPSGALMWIHGGGYIMGHPRQDDALCSEIAAALGVVVLAPQYRLAPRHAFPAALDDCRAAWNWLLAEAPALGVDAARLAIGGDSAGGGLAACVVQSICDEQPGLIAAQWLFEPMLDDRTSADGRNDDPPEYTWKNKHNRFGWAAYLGRDGGSAQVPRFAVAARYENLATLPPTWIGVGTEDLFVEECRAYARRLEQAGCGVELNCVSGAPHGFFHIAPKADITQRFKQSALAWLGHRIGS